MRILLGGGSATLLLLSYASAHDHFPGDHDSSVAQLAAQQLAARLALERAAASGPATDSGGCFVDGQWWDGADMLVSMATDGAAGPLQRVGAFEADSVPVEANCNGGEQPCTWTWAAGTADTSPVAGAAATISLSRSDGVAMQGTVTSNCSHIEWQSPAGQPDWQNLNHQVERVHVVSMTHFDLGYTENSAEHLLDDFSQTWFPAAFNVSRTLRARGGPERFVWTSHPWLLWSYLNNETGHVTAAQVADLDQAVRAGDVIWHANPMNLQFEVAEPSHMAEQLELTDRLRERYNLTTATSNVGQLAASNKDEPGATLGLVQQLASRGVSFLHIGVNDFSTVPAVPSTSAHFHGYCNAFVWRDDAATSCNTSSALVNRDEDDDEFDIEAEGCEIITAMCSGYSKSFNLGHQVPSMEVLLPDMKDSLAFLMQVDNRGPPTVDQVLQGWADTQAKYPNAKLVTSSLDNFAQVLAAKRRRDLRRQRSQEKQQRQQQQQQLGHNHHHHNHNGAHSPSSMAASVSPSSTWALPVVSNKELGSTWIFGMGADATKMAWYRAAARARVDFLAAEPGLKEDPQVREFSRLLTKLPEHTAGSSGGGCTGAPFKPGTTGDACPAGSAPWETVRTSYLDQRNYVWKAIQALGDSADGWRVLPNGAIVCESGSQCLVPAANATGADAHGCTINYAAKTDPTPECTWAGWVEAKVQCAGWDDCGGFWCDHGTCWARSKAAMGPTGIPTPFQALGFGGAVSWVKSPPSLSSVIPPTTATATPTAQQRLRAAVEAELAATMPAAGLATTAELTQAGLRPWTGVGTQAVQVGAASLEFDPTTGAIVGLTTTTTTTIDTVKAKGGEARQWSSPAMPLGLLRHAGHDEPQCNAFRDQYNLRQCASACGGCGFSKCNLGGTSTASHTLEPTLTSAWTDVSPATDSGTAPTTAARFWLNYTFGTSVRGEPPSAASLLITVNATTGTAAASTHPHTHVRGGATHADAAAAEPHNHTQGLLARQSEPWWSVGVDVQFELQWWGKAPTREAESLWFTISPLVGGAGAASVRDEGWLLDKLGRWVDPLATVFNGSRTVHHVWGGVRHVPPTPQAAVDAVGSSDDWDVDLQTLDAGLVSPSTPTLTPNGAFNLGEDGAPHPGTGGLHFNLFNNAWSTNYALFSQDSSNKFRWTLRLRA